MLRYQICFDRWHLFRHCIKTTSCYAHTYSTQLKHPVTHSLEFLH